MSNSNRKTEFSNVAAPKRPSPFSLRLTHAERVELERLANGMPLGAYIKSKIFVGGTGSRTRTKHVDRAALAKILSALGQSRIPHNLNQIAKAANIGTLPVTPELEEELQAACVEVIALRSNILAAIGKRVAQS